MEDLHNAGGLPAVLRFLLDEGLLHGDCLTVTGKTLAENLANVTAVQPSENGIIRPLNRPLKPTGHINILRGNLAPEGSVGKEGIINRLYTN
jgi:dihydroxy-acid dehydratase